MFTAGPFSGGPVRYRVRIKGRVQGVGFRAFTDRLATTLRLDGWVRNDGFGVDIEVQGPPADVEQLLLGLREEPPPLARVEAIEVRKIPLRKGRPGFIIEATRAGPARAVPAPDSAPCDACLDELFEPADRRYRYPFVSCAHCGPRFTVMRALPYARANTTMAGFTLCRVCRREHEDPRDRRFHAESVACPACGPRLAFHDSGGTMRPVADVIGEALAWIRAGRILAVKAAGGFELICDARQAETVMRLRTAKLRPEKPFAVMAANPASLRELVDLTAEEVGLLESGARPTVVAPKKAGFDAAFAAVAPKLAFLGVMLPSTPLHYLLFHEAAGRPYGTAWLNAAQEFVLVCTAAGREGEPLARDNEEAFENLTGIADAYIVHDLEISTRCEDSVVRFAEGPVFLRRARGYVPQPIALPAVGPSVLAVGGGLKNTICVTRDDEAFVSQHLGDLDRAAACGAFEEAVEQFLKLLSVRPEAVACDLHTDFYSYRFAHTFAGARGIEVLPVQHHHAHIAAIMAEHGLDGPCLGLALDGFGLGSDGGLWGGELLRVEGANCERIGHLRPLALPGGERAAREPWRMAASVLHALGRTNEISRRFPYKGADLIARMLKKGFDVSSTTSAGRLFDAAAGLLGIQDRVTFEWQAPTRLEGLAQTWGSMTPLVRGYVLSTDGTLDMLPLLNHLTDWDDPVSGAALFHATLADGLVNWATAAGDRLGVREVILGGGCFVNAILSAAVRTGLKDAGFRVFEAKVLPPNDGGLSLGQAYVAQRRLEE